MPRRDEVTRKASIAAAQEDADRPELIRVTTRGLHHSRSTTAGNCYCCGSPTSKVDDEHDDLDCLIDIEEYTRVIREIPEDMLGRDLHAHKEAADVGKYDAFAAEVDANFELPIRYWEETAALTFNVSTLTIVGSGSSRSSKTQTGVYWFGRQWLLRGGYGTLFWFLAPELSLTLVLRDKWCIGEDGGANPPVCDPELVVSAPDHEGALDMHIHMIDGSRIRLAHTKGEGGNLPGRSVAAIVWTEAAVTRSPKNYAQARGRIVSSQGQMYMDAVPEPRHWMRHSIIEPAEEEAAAEANAKAEGKEFKRKIVLKELNANLNPWNSEEAARDFVNDLQRLDPRIAARYGEGAWVGDASLAFDDVFDAATHTFDYEGWDTTYLGLEDITRRASLRLFATQKDWITSLDVNRNPHTALIWKIGVPAFTEKDGYRAKVDPRDTRFWVAVLFDVLRSWDMDSDEAAAELTRIHRGKFEGCGVVMDASSCYKRHNAGGVKNARKGTIPKQAYERAGFEVRPPDKYKTGQRNPKNPDRFDGTILTRRVLRERRMLINLFRCKPVVRALRDQETEPDGITPIKIGNTLQDRHIASCTETVRYFLWPFFSVEEVPGSLHVREYA